MVYQTRSPGQASLYVYNIRGSVIRHLLNRYLDAGTGTLFWDGRDDAGATVATGLYLVLLRSGHTSVIRKVIVIRR